MLATTSEPATAVNSAANLAASPVSKTALSLDDLAVSVMVQPASSSQRPEQQKKDGTDAKLDSTQSLPSKKVSSQEFLIVFFQRVC